MSFVVSNIIDGVYEQNSTVNNVRVDNWTAEWVIIVGNVLKTFHTYGILTHFRYPHTYTQALSTPHRSSSITETNDSKAHNIKCDMLKMH